MSHDYRQAEYDRAIETTRRQTTQKKVGPTHSLVMCFPRWRTSDANRRSATFSSSFKDSRFIARRRSPPSFHLNELRLCRSALSATSKTRIALSFLSKDLQKTINDLSSYARIPYAELFLQSRFYPRHFTPNNSSNYWRSGKRSRKSNRPAIERGAKEKLAIQFV